jgi:hypothetical protein
VVVALTEARNVLLLKAGRLGVYLEGLWFTPVGTNAACTVSIILTDGTERRLHSTLDLPATTFLARGPEFKHPMYITLEPSQELYVRVDPPIARGWFCSLYWSEP